MTFKQFLNKSVMATKKHSPAILTGVGVVGLGATAYLAYKSRKKVEAVVIDIEEARDRGVEINKMDVARDLTEVLYLPIVVGAVSVASIIASYRIQNNRIAILAGALATSQAQNLWFESRYRKQHGEEAYQRFITPVDETVSMEEGKNGKMKEKVEKTKQEVDKSIGQWYDESSEYVSDDHSYNMAYIDSVSEKLQTILFQRGHLLLNEVREAMGFDRIRSGALLGWSSADIFNIDKIVTVMEDKHDGELKEQIWVSWSRPRYIHDEVEFNGRYSIH